MLTCLTLNGIPATPIHTGPRVRPIATGSYELRANVPQRGLSDILACIPPVGRLALIELKTGRARRSPAQIRAQKRFAASGALSLVIRDITQLIKEFPWPKGHRAGPQPKEPIRA